MVLMYYDMSIGILPNVVPEFDCDTAFMFLEKISLNLKLGLTGQN